MSRRFGDPAAIGRLVIAVTGMVIALGLGLGGLWAVLHDQWTRLYGPNEHGYLVLAMGVWIAAIEWRERPVRTFAPAFVALAPLGLCVALLWLMGEMDFGLMRIALLPLFVIFTIASVLGWQAARRLLWAPMFAYFALPQWEVINGPLQDATVLAVSTMLRWFDVPAFLEGNVVDIPAGTFEIASGCSGLNYLMAGTALAAFVALTRLDRWKARFVLVGIAAAGAIVFNWIRVFLIIVIGHLSDMQHYLVRVEHHTFGWVLFLLLIGSLIIVASRAGSMSENEQPTTAGPADESNPSGLIVPWSVVAMTVPVAGVLLAARLVG